MRRIYREWLAVPLGPAFVAAAVSLVASFAARLLLRVPTPAELYGDRATVLIPLPLFSALLEVFGTNAKHLFFFALVAGAGLLAALGGVLYWNGRRALRARAGGRIGRFALGEMPSWAEAPAIIVALYLAMLLIVSPLLGAGLFGVQLAGGAVAALVALLFPIAAFALTFVALLRREGRSTSPFSRGAGAPAAPASDPGLAAAAPSAAASAPRSYTRRRLLRDSAFAAALLGGGALAWEFISSGLGNTFGLRPATTRAPHLNISDVPARIVPPPTPEYGAWTDVTNQTPEVTPTDSFYYVSKNIGSDPDVGAGGWRLKIDGLVERPYTLTYDDVKALPRIERYHTLECISNWVGGPLMSNAYFTGVSLADVLNRAGIKPGASELIFRAADDYSDRLHLAQALDSRSLIVYEINGEPLPQAHGYPARLLIPGLYGMKNGKWLTSLTVDAGDYTGYWEERGWTREAHVKTMTRIDVPADGDLVPARPGFIAGVAYATDRGVARVDVSTDGGETWQAATLRRPLNDLTWVLWELPWTPAPGGYYIVARAVESDGSVQSPAEAEPLPDGASGYHVAHVVAR